MNEEQSIQKEESLSQQIQEPKKKGLKVKGWWFCLRTRQILVELQPEVNFCYSDARFLASRRGIEVCNKHAKRSQQINTVPSTIRRTPQEGDQVWPLGQWTPCTIANMDQTPMPFTFSYGLIPANALSECVEVLLGSKNVSAQPSLPFLLMVNQE